MPIWAAAGTAQGHGKATYDPFVIAQARHAVGAYIAGSDLVTAWGAIVR